MEGRSTMAGPLTEAEAAAYIAEKTRRPTSPRTVKRHRLDGRIAHTIIGKSPRLRRG